MKNTNVLIFQVSSHSSSTIKKTYKLFKNFLNFISLLRRGHKLDTNDFYTELNVRGFDYGPKFQQIQEVQYNGLDKSYSKVKWDGNLITFVESLIQLYLTHTTNRSIHVLQSLPSLKCDPRMLFNNNEIIGSADDGSEEESAEGTVRKLQELLSVITDTNLKCVVSKGISTESLLTFI